MRIGATLLAIAAVFSVASCDRAPAPEAPDRQSSEATGKGIDRSHAGQLLPELEIRNSEDEAASLAGEKGEPLLVNLWATWCAPCVKELPTLEALGERDGAPRVIAVSQDIAPRASVDAFLDDHQLDGLETWQDSEMALSEALGAEILPTTIYYDAQGREIWRYVGDLDWTGEEAARLLAESGGGA